MSIKITKQKTLHKLAFTFLFNVLNIFIFSLLKRLF